MANHVSSMIIRVLRSSITEPVSWCNNFNSRSGAAITDRNEPRRGGAPIDVDIVSSLDSLPSRIIMIGDRSGKNNATTNALLQATPQSSNNYRLCIY